LSGIAIDSTTSGKESVPVEITGEILKKKTFKVISFQQEVLPREGVNLDCLYIQQIFLRA